MKPHPPHHKAPHPPHPHSSPHHPPAAPLHRYQLGQPNRYSAKNMAKPVPFTCVAPKAQQVCVVGDFNQWDPAAHPMQRQPDGAWRLQIELNHGHHHFRFLVDGSPALDPRASGVARDAQGEKVSVVAVS